LDEPEKSHLKGTTHLPVSANLNGTWGELGENIKILKKEGFITVVPEKDSAYKSDWH